MDDFIFYAIKIGREAYMNKYTDFYGIRTRQRWRGPTDSSVQEGNLPGQHQEVILHVEGGGGLYFLLQPPHTGY
jgi:hypothetical protein